MATPSKRAAFTGSITFISNYSLDDACRAFVLILASFDFGTHTETSDIGFEYPASGDEATGHANPFTETRTTGHLEVDQVVQPRWPLTIGGREDWDTRKTNSFNPQTCYSFRTGV